MDWPSLIGRIGSGFAVKIAVAIGAFVLAHSIYEELAKVAARISGVMQ